MTSGICHVVHFFDRSVWVDQKADSLGEVGELLARVAKYLVSAANAFVGVAK